MTNSPVLLTPRRLFLGGLGAALLAGHARADAAADAIVKQADTARGGGLPGISWTIRLTSSGNDDATDGDRELAVKANTNASVAETLEPVRFRGTKLLQSDRNMWLSRPGLSKPIPISPRQRLSGQAANGDIAATNYATDYSATLLREENVGNEPCYVLNLVAKSKYSTYDQIQYWVSKTRHVAVQAEFKAVSGKPIKSATFQYANSIEFDGKPIPFVSRMTIKDALTPAQTVMDYSNVAVATIPSSAFDVGSLQ
jgi:hypothetical protein